MTHAKALQVVAIALLAGPAAVAQDVVLSDMGVRFLGGERVEVTRTAGQNEVADYNVDNHIVVTYFVPAASVSKPAVVMTPGMGLRSDIFLSTADGRAGWAVDFLRRGHPVYLVERVHTMAAGFPPATADTGTPRMRLWGAEEVWTRWGVGPRYGEFFDDSRFPADSYDRMIASLTPIRRLPHHRRAEPEVRNIAALTALLEEIGAAFVLVHSASGNDAFQGALTHPELFLGIINVEPVGCLTDSEDLQAIAGVPLLSVFGDHMEVRPQMPPRFDQCQEAIDHHSAIGQHARMLDLPRMGISGNSHMMMLENNSEQISALMLDWIDQVISD